MEQKAIVVGATSGMGRALAVKLGQEGYRVGIVGRRVDLLQELVDLKPDTFVAAVEDISRPDASQVLGNLTRELGGLDLLVMAAGYGAPYNPLEHNVTVDIVRTNIVGFTSVVDWGLQYFLDQGYGQLVGFTSIAGMRGCGVDPGYCAAKAFQMNYLEGMRQVIDQFKLPICITEIRPGFVEKNDAHVKNRFWIDPLDRATLRIYKGILRRRNVVYLSKRWVIISFLMRIVPRPLMGWLMRDYLQPDVARPVLEPRSVRPPEG